MTPEQAINYLQLEELCHKIQRPCESYCGTCPYYVTHKNLLEAYNMALEALRQEIKND